MCRETRFWSKSTLIMCLLAHNYLIFGLTRHIITWVLDQSTLKNLRSEFAHVLLAHSYVRFGLILRDLVSILPEKCKESVLEAQTLWWNQVKSTDSLMLSGKSYRFFAEIRRTGRAGRAHSLDTHFTARRENPLLAGQLPREPRALAPKFPQSKR